MPVGGRGGSGPERLPDRTRKGMEQPKTETEFVRVVKPSGGSGYVSVPKRYLGRVAWISIQPDNISPRLFIEALVGPKLATLILDSLEERAENEIQERNP